MGILLTATGAAAEGATGIAAIIPLIAWFVIIIGFMYFFMIRPQKKEQKKHQAMLSTLECGDCVLTTSGFYGLSLTLRTTQSSWNLVITRTAVSPCRNLQLLRSKKLMQNK